MKTLILLILLSSAILEFTGCMSSYNEFNNMKLRYDLLVKDTYEGEYIKFVMSDVKNRCAVCENNRYLEIRNGYFNWSSIPFVFPSNLAGIGLKPDSTRYMMYPFKFTRSKEGFYLEANISDTLYRNLQYSFDGKKNSRTNAENLTAQNAFKDGYTQFLNTDTVIYTHGRKFECLLFKEYLDPFAHSTNYQIVYLEKRTAVPIMVTTHLEFSDYTLEYSLLLSAIDPL